MPAGASKRTPRRGRKVVVRSPRRVHLRGRPGHRVTHVISQIPHRKQRYETVGDWIPGNPVRILVSSMKDERYSFLVALHEMIESELCRMNGIPDNKVVEFDTNFEKERRAKLHSVEAEPGDDPRAPYRDEHGFATMIERMVARKMGVSWSAYEKAVVALSPRPGLPVKPLLGN